MIDVDAFIERERCGNYDCWAFVCDVWAQSFQEDLSHFTAKGKLEYGVLRRFKLVDSNTDPSIVIFRRAFRVPHAGVWYNGRVLHLGEQRAQYQPLHLVGRQFQRVEFYA